MRRIRTASRISRRFRVALLSGCLLQAGDDRLAEGKAAFSNRKFEDAINLLGKVQTGASKCEADFYLGLAYYRIKQFDPAIIHLRSATVCAPGNSDSFVALAAAYFAKGDDDHAVAAFDDALKLQPGNVEALRAAAVLDLKHERNERAVAKLEKLVALEPANAQAHSDLGAAYAGTGNSAKARGQFQQSLELRPENSSALLGLGRFLQKSGQTEEAMRVLRRASKAEPTAYEPHFLLASAYNTLEHFQEALAESKEAIRLGAGDAETYYQMARAYRGLGRPEQARQSLRRFSALRSQAAQNVEERKEAAKLLLQAKPLVAEGKLPEAIRLLEQAAALDKSNPQILFRLSGLYYDTQQLAQARDYVQAAIHLSPAESLYHYLAGLIEKSSGKPEAARESFETAIRLNPSAADALNELGTLAMARRRYAEAADYFKNAAEIDPGEAAYRLNLEAALELQAK